MCCVVVIIIIFVNLGICVCYFVRKDMCGFNRGCGGGGLDFFLFGNMKVIEYLL